MWYPTVEDVLGVYERIAGGHSPAPAPGDKTALARLTLAPQWAGGENRSAETIARKAAAIFSRVAEEDPFGEKGIHVAYALVDTFLERNGFAFQAGLAAARRQVEKLREGELPAEDLAAWIGARLEQKETQFNARRVFAALGRMARVIERLKSHPDGEGLAKRLDAAGYAICTELIEAFQPGEEARKRILRSYPAVEERWGTVIREESPDDVDE